MVLLRARKVIRLLNWMQMLLALRSNTKGHHLVRFPVPYSVRYSIRRLLGGKDREGKGDHRLGLTNFCNPWYP